LSLVSASGGEQGSTLASSVVAGERQANQLINLAAAGGVEVKQSRSNGTLQKRFFSNETR